jgi:hypothetical protein
MRTLGRPITQADAMAYGLSLSETDRLSRCLDRLTPHLRLDQIAITGGVGMQFGFAELGRQDPRDQVADLDLVATSLEAISPGVVGQFLVSHYHVVRPSVPKFMIQLVDPESRLRVDIFPDLAGWLGEARTIAFGRHSIRLLPLARIFEHKAQTLSRASESAPIDPKHVRHAEILGVLLGRPVPQVAQEALAPDVYGIEADGACERCALSSHPGWPLAPKDRIVELLSWDRLPDIHLQPSAAGAMMGRG